MIGVDALNCVESREREFRLRVSCRVLYLAVVHSGPTCVTQKLLHALGVTNSGVVVIESLASPF